ncbi:hypothetical protein PanWU01x14_026160 [Parasponia andersonii]|uniref:Uncharacterized protein n=1 Tax=Parasponia andersonii TaxID=3476 RepID=A0A2P5DW07_PARAD|nr:hypothetical protein PanWU01x14_026160 [Parasponia andersonii]
MGGPYSISSSGPLAAGVHSAHEFDSLSLLAASLYSINDGKRLQMHGSGFDFFSSGSPLSLLFWVNVFRSS